MYYRQLLSLSPELLETVDKKWTQIVREWKDIRSLKTSESE